ncbi:MAG: aldehyde ferredoxin oxidoreductase family protein [Chloroflexi bacterium]|nr:aldehyde ferredoxin oxidoreductase family protein [Chloroflexota bacterium]
MNYGFMGKILRVNLSAGELSTEPINQEWTRKYLGGAGLATRYLYDEMPAGADPLGPDNPLIFMTGLLTGTASASASRYSVVSKSPQTGIWGQANSGGSFGPALKRSGYDGVIFEGISPRPVYLKIVAGQAELCDADHLWGKTVPETEDAIQDGSDHKFTIASIGPAGENLVRFAAIMNNKHRAAGRCGLGAVMGSKRLKAIACSGKDPVRIAHEDQFRESARRQIGFLDESMLKVVFDTFGTNMIADMVNVRGGYPTRNWQESVFEDIEAVNAEGIADSVFIEGVACFACPVTCGRRTEIREGKWQGNTGEGPEYETTNTFGAMCGISDINAITMANYLCNQYGLDTISTGSTIAFSMECFERGILTQEHTHGLEIKFGDADLIVELVEKIARREGIGNLLAEGSRIMAQKLGQDSQHFAMHVKGLELPAYDPRAAKICGLGYVSANRGGDHITSYVEAPTFIDVPLLVIEDSTIKDPFIADPAEARVIVDLENALTALDAIGCCKFMGMGLTAKDMVDLVGFATGWDFTIEEYVACGERNYNLARAFCIREGIDRQMDILPERLMQDPLPSGPAENMLIERETMEEMKDAYYQFRGWDSSNGFPRPEKLIELGLEDLVIDLWGV